MQTSHRKKAFSDPQSLAATPTVAAALSAKFHKTSTQVDQRFKELKTVFLDSHLFPTTHTLSSSTLTPSDADSSAAKATVKV